MRILSSSVLPLALALAVYAAPASAALSTETRSVGDFNGLDINGPFDVEVCLQKKSELTVEGDSKALPHVRTEVIHGILHVQMDQGTTEQPRIHLTLTAHDIGSVHVGGSAQLFFKGQDDRGLHLSAPPK